MAGICDTRLFRGRALAAYAVPMGERSIPPCTVWSAGGGKGEMAGGSIWPHSGVEVARSGLDPAPWRPCGVPESTSKCGQMEPNGATFPPSAAQHDMGSGRCALVYSSRREGMLRPIAWGDEIDICAVALYMELVA